MITRRPYAMIEERRAILADARRSTIVTSRLVCRAFNAGLPDSLLYAAAGAGLADYHRRQGITVDIAAELADVPLPKAYFDGYNSEMIAGSLAAELNKAMNP